MALDSERTLWKRAGLKYGPQMHTECIYGFIIKPRLPLV